MTSLSFLVQRYFASGKNRDLHQSGASMRHAVATWKSPQEIMHDEKRKLLAEKKMTGRHFLFGHFFIAPTCAKILADEEQKAFFDLLTANRGGTPFTDKLKALVDDAKRNTQWRVQFMTWERQQVLPPKKLHSFSRQTYLRG